MPPSSSASSSISASASTKTRPWPGHQRPNAARTSLQPKTPLQKSNQQQDMKRSQPAGKQLARVAGQTISTGSLAAALSQYRPASADTKQQQTEASSYLQVSYQPSSSASASQQAELSHSQAPLLIKRSPRLKFVKCLLLALMALDLLLTCLLYQLARDDQLQVWRWRLRLSLLNLVLTAGWFALLIGALLFHLYRVLIASALLHLASFGLLFVLSLVHFARRIDYNTVHLAKLLALLFAIIMLHVYLLVMASLTLYLARGVRRRHRQHALQLGLNQSTGATLSLKSSKKTTTARN